MTIKELERAIGTSEFNYKFEKKGFVSLQIDATERMSTQKALC